MWGMGSVVDAGWCLASLFVAVMPALTSWGLVSVGWGAQPVLVPVALKIGGPEMPSVSQLTQ